MKEHFKKWFNLLPAGDHPRDGAEWAWEGWQAAIESRVLADTRDKALEEAAEICKTWNTTPGSRLAAEILALKSESRVLAERKPVAELAKWCEEQAAIWRESPQDDPTGEAVKMLDRVRAALTTHPTQDDADNQTGELSMNNDQQKQFKDMADFIEEDGLSEQFRIWKELRAAWNIDASIDRARQSGEEGND